MYQAKCIKKSTNFRRFGEKVTHRYHSVDALNFISLPKEVPGPMPAQLTRGILGIELPFFF
jgi:hypothetical protein